MAKRLGGGLKRRWILPGIRAVFRQNVSCRFLLGGKKMGEDKRDWNNMSSMLRGEDPVKFQWSPIGDENVRVLGKDGRWRYGKAKKASEAHAVACRILQEGEEGKGF
jgi:hypothetical protein